MSASAASLLRRSLIAAFVAIGAIAASAGPAAADTVCTRVAAPNGSDSGAGTAGDPYATAQRLVRSLQPGDTGCLRAGTYSENVTIDNGGSGDDSRVTLTSYPGDRATLDGRLYISDNANYVTVSNLELDGRDAPTCPSGATCTHLPSPTVNGDGIIFSGLGSTSSNDNVVEHNIITNAKLRYNVESYYPDAVGSGNVVRDNCLYGGARGNVMPSQYGFQATNNMTADPHYADP